MKGMRALGTLRLPFLGQGPHGEPADAYPEVAESVRQAYPAVEPSRAFRDALHARLLAEAAWLKAHPVETPREAAMRRSMLVAAALLMLCLAALAWRGQRTQTAAAE